ncbi:MAG: DUF192 domain-containing protein [Rubellimicrobium sp.]|nr:DUF192 domain-containing protein [Rubellimicrobium sp.]
MQDATGRGQRSGRGIRALSGGALASVLGVALAGAAAAAPCRDDRVTITGPWGSAAFTVAVADDAAERAQGLMNVPELPLMAGMLFVYETPQTVAFWMRNTFIPLDMIFADGAGVVRLVHENAIPHDDTPIPGGDGVQFVLEINGGLAARLGIGPGDVMQHPAIGPDAAMPCAAAIS